VLLFGREGVLPPERAGPDWRDGTRPGDSIDKDDIGDGVLLNEVSGTVGARDPSPGFCPRNTIVSDDPPAPEWDCTKSAIRWRLVRQNGPVFRRGGMQPVPMLSSGPEKH
jgi:hypothetical protein